MTKTILFTALTAFFLIGCKEPGRGSLTVNIKDGPAGLDEINIDLKSIEVYIENSDQGRWCKLRTNKGIYNILEFQNTSALVAIQEEVPEGKVSFIKLVLGRNNSVIESGMYKPLLTKQAPGTDFSVIVPVECTIAPNQRSNILLDIDAERSVTRTPSGNFLLHPIAASGLINAPMEIY